ncbi:MAG: hypothetical protein ACRDTH_21160 [Pseudonocardiaceae bacterium]
MRRVLQQVLAGMPERRPKLVVYGRSDGQMVVVGDEKVALSARINVTTWGCATSGW